MQSKLPVSSVHIEVKAPVAHFQCHALRLSMSGHWWLNQSDSLLPMTCKTLTQQYRSGGTSSRCTQEISILDFIRGTTNSQLSTRIHLHLHWIPASSIQCRGPGDTSVHRPPPAPNVYHLPARALWLFHSTVSYTIHHYQTLHCVRYSIYHPSCWAVLNKYQDETWCFIPSALTW